MKKFLILLAFVLPIAFAFTSPAENCVTCVTPDTASKTAETLTTISFSWDAVDGADAYILKYVRQSDNYSIGDITVTNTSHTYTNMEAGTYDFYFTSRCGGTTSIPWIIIDDISGI